MESELSYELKLLQVLYICENYVSKRSVFCVDSLSVTSNWLYVKHFTLTENKCEHSSMCGNLCLFGRRLYFVL